MKHNSLITVPPRPSLLMCVAVLVIAGIAVSHWIYIATDIPIPITWLGIAFILSLAGCALRHNAVPITLAAVLLGATLDAIQWEQFVTEACNEATVHEAEIIDVPRHRDKSTVLKVKLTDQQLSPIMLTTLRDTTLQRGRHIIFKGQLEKVKPAIRPYFHYDTWLLHQGIYWRAFAPHHIMVPDTTFTPTLPDRLLARLRESPLSTDITQIVEAMVLGNKSNLSPELRDTYAMAGGSHLLALSGLHLGIIVGVLMLLMGHNYRLRTLRLIVTLPLIWWYVWLTGAPVSLLRAAIMLSVWLMADCAGRRVTGSDSLTFAVLLILVLRPFWLFDTGFQLSVVSLLGLTSISHVRRNWHITFQIKNNITRYLFGLLLSGAVATIATAPIVAVTFHRISLWGWLMSIAYIPITTLVLPACFLLIEWPTQWLAWIIDTILHLQLWLMQHTSGTIDGLYPSWRTVIIAYAVMLLFVYRRKLAMYLAASTLLLSVTSDHIIPVTPAVYFEDTHATVVQSRHTIHRLPCADTTFYHNGLYSYGSITILRVDNTLWSHTYRSTPLSVDYLWLCRGYKGHIAELQKSVKPRCIVLDASLSPFYRSRFKSECISQSIPIYMFCPQKITTQRHKRNQSADNMDIKSCR